MRLYYHFSADYAIVLVMNEAHTETVIIPHPTEMKKLTDLQKRVLRVLQEQCADGTVWVPTFPLYVRGWTCADENLAAWGKRITDCTLAGVRLSDDGECLVADAKITAQTETLLGAVTLARQLRTTGDAAHGAMSENSRDKAQTAIAAIAESALPLRLPVFREARVEFVCAGARTEWTVGESRWIKGCTMPRGASPAR